MGTGVSMAPDREVRLATAAVDVRATTAAPLHFQTQAQDPLQYTPDARTQRPQRPDILRVGGARVSRRVRPPASAPTAPGTLVAPPPQGPQGVNAGNLQANPSYVSDAVPDYTRVDSQSFLSSATARGPGAASIFTLPRYEDAAMDRPPRYSGTPPPPAEFLASGHVTPPSWLLPPWAVRRS